MLLVIRFLRRAKVGQQGHGRISRSPLTDPLLSTINKFADCEQSYSREGEIHSCSDVDLFVFSVDKDHVCRGLSRNRSCLSTPTDGIRQLAIRRLSAYAVHTSTTLLNCTYCTSVLQCSTTALYKVYSSKRIKYVLSLLDSTVLLYG